jgi:hypothetical protein
MRYRHTETNDSKAQGSSSRLLDSSGSLTARPGSGEGDIGFVQDEVISYRGRRWDRGRQSN